MTAQNTTMNGKQETKIIPDALYDFSIAVMGNSCRTCPVMALQGDNNGYIAWLEAYQTRQGSWKLFKRYQEFDIEEATATDNDFFSHILSGQFEQIEIRQEPSEDDQQDQPTTFTLMDIMFKMAQFEKAGENQQSAQDTLTLTNFENHDVASLGTQHYRAFGMRECIAFDSKTGLPTPSFEGKIVGNGYFSTADEALIKEAWEAKVDQYGHEGSYLDALQINGKPLHMLDDLYHNLNKQRAYQEIIEYFEDNIFGIFRDCAKLGFDSSVTIEKDGHRPQMQPIGQALEIIISSALNENVIETEFKDLLSDDEIQNIRKALISLDIFRAILHARWSIDIAAANPHLTEHSEEFVKQQIASIQQKYSDYDLQEVDEDLVTRAILDRSSAQAMNIDNTIERIRSDLKILSDQSAQNAKSLQHAQPTLSTTTGNSAPKRGLK